MAGEHRQGRWVLRVLLIMLLMAAGLVAWVAGAQPVHAESNFIITDYDIDMQVNEDDTYLITETLQVHFTAPSHGIYRVVPYRMHLDRDGQVTNCYGKVYDFQMLSGQPVDDEKGDDVWYFKIGDPDKYADEDTLYQYSYVFDMKGDHLKGADEVYYNLVGTSWEAQNIEHVSFRVTFPKPIDMKKVGMKTGDDVDVPFETNGDTEVYGETTENVMGGLTIRAVLPQGYFTKQASTSNLLIYILIAIMAAATLFGFLMWRKHGVDPQIVETEEFYPPEGLTAPEVSYLEAGEIEGKSVTSLLLELADKGYLKINEKEVAYGLKKKKTKTDYEIVQVKPYDGNSPDERAFMRGLFAEGRVVQMDDLKDSFYKTVNEIKEDIADRYKGQLYDAKAASCASTLWAISVGAMIALVVICKLLNGSPFIVGNGDTLINLVMLVLEIVLPLAGFMGIAKWINKPRKKAISIILGFIGWSLLALLGFGLAVLFDTCMGAQIFPYFIGLLMVFVLNVMSELCERRTDEYTEILGKIRGYKRFLQVAEKERMEMLAEQDPNYYYKNLAFAFALGVTAVYAKNFASLATQPPQWYTGPYMYGYYSNAGGTFDSMGLMGRMDNMMSSISTTMTSSPSSGGGGGSFSGGGGAGGGGGGSW